MQISHCFNVLRFNKTVTCEQRTLNCQDLTGKAVVLFVTWHVGISMELVSMADSLAEEKFNPCCEICLLAVGQHFVLGAGGVRLNGFDQLFILITGVDEEPMITALEQHSYRIWGNSSWWSRDLTISRRTALLYISGSEEIIRGMVHLVRCSCSVFRSRLKPRSGRHPWGLWRYQWSRSRRASSALECYLRLFRTVLIEINDLCHRSRHISISCVSGSSIQLAGRVDVVWKQMLRLP
ncbi:hypothetical protein Tco_0839572 [Tanacetum coccineum]|uniref:Uncharacterized protein n=1 Tax=Tanacetum coccineum TaxID=301880 RepID=A0ABQ5AR03_9ASTR